MKKSLLLLSMLALALVTALAGGSCASSKNQPESTPTPSAASATATQISNEAAEAAATTFVEAWETINYHDQEGRFNRVLLLLSSDRLAQYAAFHENPYVRMYEVTGTTAVVSSRVTETSGGVATVAVTTQRTRHLVVPGSESVPVEQSSIEQMECHLVLEGGQWLVQSWQIESEQLLPTEGTAVTATATPSPNTSSATLSMIAGDFIASYASAITEDVGGGVVAQYTDSTGTTWARIKTLEHGYDVNGKEVTTPYTGIIKETSDDTWELVSLGNAGVACGLAADVQSALEFLVCTPGPMATAWAEEDEQADQAVKGTASSAYNARVDDKMYYTDSDGNLWLQFNISPVPNDLTDPARGYMVKLPDGKWRVVSGPGTAMMECDLPVEVQTAFRHRTCLPDEAALDGAIRAFVRQNEPEDVDKVIIDAKRWDDSSSQRTWVQAGVLLVRGESTAQVYILMRKRPEGGWEGVASPSTDSSVWCDAPANVLPRPPYCPTPTPPAS